MAASRWRARHTRIYEQNLFVFTPDLVRFSQDPFGRHKRAGVGLEQARGVRGDVGSANTARPRGTRGTPAGHVNACLGMLYAHIIRTISFAPLDPHQSAGVEVFEGKVDELCRELGERGKA